MNSLLLGAKISDVWTNYFTVYLSPILFPCKNTPEPCCQSELHEHTDRVAAEIRNEGGVAYGVWNGFVRKIIELFLRKIIHVFPQKKTRCLTIRSRRRFQIDGDGDRFVEEIRTEEDLSFEDTIQTLRVVNEI